jgi:hypothetical protein
MTHRDAADTAQGILQWWLHQDWAEGGTAQVQKALGVLVERGLLTKTTVPARRKDRMNEKQIFRINTQLLSEIEAFLNNPKS